MMLLLVWVLAVFNGIVLIGIIIASLHHMRRSSIVEGSH